MTSFRVSVCDSKSLRLMTPWSPNGSSDYRWETLLVKLLVALSVSTSEIYSVELLGLMSDQTMGHVLAIRSDLLLDWLC